MFIKTFHESILIKTYKFAPTGWINGFDQRRGPVRFSNTLKVHCVVFMRICVGENIDWYTIVKRYGDTFCRPTHHTHDIVSARETLKP